VLGLQDALLAAADDAKRPVLLVVDRLLNGGGRPDLQVECLDISLEPVAELGSGAVDLKMGKVSVEFWGRRSASLAETHGPVGRERHVGEVVGPVGEVQAERLVSEPPVVTDALLAVDDEDLDTESLQAGGRRETIVTGTDCAETSRIAARQLAASAIAQLIERRWARHSLTTTSGSSVSNSASLRRSFSHERAPMTCPSACSSSGNSSSSSAAVVRVQAS
jgi:hypothetical protein